MSLKELLRMIYRLAGVVALCAVPEVSPSSGPVSADSGNRPSAPTLLGSPAIMPAGTPTRRPERPTPRLENFGRIPLSFEANRGRFHQFHGASSSR